LHPFKVDGRDLQCPDQEEQNDQCGLLEVLQVFRFRRSSEIRPGYQLRF
jgi:hypothetical protein